MHYYFTVRLLTKHPCYDTIRLTKNLEVNCMKKITKILSVALLAVMCLTLLVACAPNSDPDKAVEHLKKNDYIATKTPGVGKHKYTVTGIGKLGTETAGEFIMIFYYESSADAKDSLEDVRAEFNKKKDDDSDWVFKQFGSMVYFGTKDAVKAAM